MLILPVGIDGEGLNYPVHCNKPQGCHAMAAINRWDMKGDGFTFAGVCVLFRKIQGAVTSGVFCRYMYKLYTDQ